MAVGDNSFAHFGADKIEVYCNLNICGRGPRDCIIGRRLLSQKDIDEWNDQGDEQPGEERMKTLLETVAVIHVSTKFVIF